jgi:hypothetical protein
MISTFIIVSVFHMISTFMTSVYFTWYLHLWHQCFSHDIDIHDISVFLTWHQCLYDISNISHNIYIIDISVFHMTSTFINITAFSDMTSTLMTSVYFIHDIYIDDISTFQTWHIQYDISVFQTGHLYLLHQCFSGIIYGISVF